MERRAVAAAVVELCWLAGSEMTIIIPMQNRTPYQDRIIRNYYQNQDAIQTQRLGELVTDLYLAQGKSRVTAWKRVVAALEKLKVPATRIQHLVKSDNPALVADLLQELLNKK